MSDFVYDNTSIPDGKVDLVPLPVGSDPNNYCSSADWNKICAALIDLRAAVKAGVYHGLTAQAVDFVPGGTNFRFWYNGSKLLTKSGTSDAVALVFESRRLIAGTGLSGGGTFESDRTISLASLDPSPAGVYVRPESITVDVHGRVTSVNGDLSRYRWTKDEFEYADIRWNTLLPTFISLATPSDPVWAGGWVILESQPGYSQTGLVSQNPVFSMVENLEVRMRVKLGGALSTSQMILAFTANPEDGMAVSAAVVAAPGMFANFTLVTIDTTPAFHSVDLGVACGTSIFELRMRMGASALTAEVYNDSGVLLGSGSIDVGLPSPSTPLYLSITDMANTDPYIKTYIDWIEWRQ